MAVRAILGEVIVAGDGPVALTEATQAMLSAILAEAGIEASSVVSAVFTVTPDISHGFPAAAARAMGWTDVPLLCAASVPVPGAPERCIQVLLHLAVEG